MSLFASVSRFASLRADVFSRCLVLPFSIVLAWDAFGSLNASYGYCDCVDAVESITLIVSNERRCDLNLGVIPGSSWNLVAGNRRH